MPRRARPSSAFVLALASSVKEFSAEDLACLCAHHF
jgi:hypothetical protein